MTVKQIAVMEYIRAKGSITVAQAVPLIGENLYANANFHVGNVLRRMVERKWLVRKSRGCYTIQQLSPVLERVKQESDLGELFTPPQ